MIDEIGHFALVLALCIAAVQIVVPLFGASRHDAALVALARPAALAQFVFIATAFLSLMHAYAVSRFLGAQRRRQFQRRQAAALQDHRRVEQPRRLDAPVGVHAGAVRRRGGPVRRQPAARIARPGAGGAGDDRRRVSHLHPLRPRTRFCGSIPSRSTATGSTRFSRIAASPFTRRCSTPAMSGSRSRSASRSPR